MSMGHNQPPSALAFVEVTKDMIHEWLKEHPTVTEADIKEARNLETQALRAFQEAEAERKAKGEPLRLQVAQINENYNSKLQPLDRSRALLKQRLDDYIRAKEAERAEELRQAQAVAAAKVEAARKAAEAAQEAEANAQVGELVDVGKAMDDAFNAHQEARAAERAVKIAEKDATVRISSGIGRSRGLSEPEVLTVVAWIDAIYVIGLTDGIRDAILSGARAYRKLHGKLPRGIHSSKHSDVKG